MSEHGASPIGAEEVANERDIDRFRKLAAERGITIERIEPEPFDAEAPVGLDLRDLAAVIFTSGFRPDYTSWVHLPGAQDDDGFPIHDQCASTVAAGLYFVGTHFLRKRKSSLLVGVGEDAAIVATRYRPIGPAQINDHPPRGSRQRPPILRARFASVLKTWPLVKPSISARIEFLGPTGGAWVRG